MFTVWVVMDKGLSYHMIDKVETLEQARTQKRVREKFARDNAAPFTDFGTVKIMDEARRVWVA